MSFLRKIVGKKTEHKTSEFSAAINQMRETEDILNKKQRYLEAKIEKEINTAKLNANKNKKVALQALQRKKRYEKQLQQIDATLSTLEIQREGLENAQTSNLAINSLKTAEEALKSAHKNMSLEKVESLLDNLADEKEKTSEITDAFCTSSGDELDEDELLKELEELEVEEDGKISLPDIPTKEVDKQIGKKKEKKAEPLAM